MPKASSPAHAIAISARSVQDCQERRDVRGEGGWIFEERQMAAIGHDLDSRVWRQRAGEGANRVGWGVAIFFTGDREALDGVERRQIAGVPGGEGVGGVRVGRWILTFESIDEPGGQRGALALRSDGE